jgi:hypothetical protein
MSILKHLKVLLCFCNSQVGAIQCEWVYVISLGFKQPS